MPTAIQTPLTEGKAEKVGRKLYRKQILPVGEVKHDGKLLQFKRPYLERLANNFTAGKMDQVPFTLVDGENRHNDDPERVRGELATVEVRDDGLYGLISLSDDGDKLVSDNPKLGVSVRIDQDNMVLKHVAGTLDPVVKGMKPWEKIELSDSSTTIIDLSDDEFAKSSDGDIRHGDVTATETLTAEDRELLKPILAKLRKEEAEPSDADLDKLVESILEAEQTEQTEEKEPVALSDEAKQQLDLAVTAAKSAQTDAQAARDELAKVRWAAERAKYEREGVPPKLLNLAAPHLSKASSVIELSNSDSQASAMKQMLDEAKGTIDFTERGSGDADEESQLEEAKRLAREWHEAATGEKVED